MTSRRPALPAALLGAALLLGGCGVTQRQGAAVVSSSGVVTQSEVATATSEYNVVIKDAVAQDPNRRQTESQTALLLALGPYVVERASAKGWAPGAAVSRALAALSGPAPATVDLIRTLDAAGSLTRDDVAKVLAAATAAGVQINPRYGSFDLTRPDLQGGLPNWIAPTRAAPTPTSGQ